MERIVKFLPAYDKRNPDPGKNYGIHGVDLIMILKGELGAVQFVLFTNWHLPHVQNEFLRKCTRETAELYLVPNPSDLGYHSLHSMYEEQSVSSESCAYLDGKPCYYGGSSLASDEIYQVLLKKGSDGVWEELEKYYNDIFNITR